MNIILGVVETRFNQFQLERSGVRCRPSQRPLVDVGEQRFRRVRNGRPASRRAT